MGKGYGFGVALPGVEAVVVEDSEKAAEQVALSGRVTVPGSAPLIVAPSGAG
jgi:hypothetical protein